MSKEDNNRKDNNREDNNREDNNNNNHELITRRWMNKDKILPKICTKWKVNVRTEIIKINLY